jgi:O-antigen/teichoic acid export membrane protein
MPSNDFGFWMIISSILVWFNFFDFGLGNGMRNDLTKSMIRNDIQDVRVLISSSYFALFCVALFLSFGLLLLDYYDWLPLLFGKSARWIIENEKPITILFVSTIFQIYFKLVLYVYMADNKFFINGLSGFIVQVCTLSVLYFLSFLQTLNLYYVVLVNAILPLIVFINCGLLILRNGLLKRPKQIASRIVLLPAPFSPTINVDGESSKLISVN